MADALVRSAASGRRRGRLSALVPALAFVGIVVAVMQTLIVPVIKDLPGLLDTEASNATWVVTATLLSGAVATPDPISLVGPFLAEAERSGVRRVVLLGSAIAFPNAPGRIELEDRVRRQPGWVALRPSGFMENFLRPHPTAQGIRERGDSDLGSVGPCGVDRRPRHRRVGRRGAG
ncbi:hypothetical protein [Pseudonocardia sp. MH-G8]|uniref:hypothetical protein n=1 Tax=Pseudonocardia sp. MH-G8 TaxID=1854588 RepID=UPI0018EA2086|nr:hypothetical protein [Pseudonocardia sp. MH-G8]